MSVLPRREIDEIITLHELRPGLQEIYVEGTEDKMFFEWFLFENDLRDVAVFEISAVNIPAAEILKRNLTDNNRSRVITLSYLLNDRIRDLRQIICIADADLDYGLGIEYQSRLLLLTDYTSIEMYAYNEKAIHKLLRVVVGGFDKNAQQVLEEIQTPLQFQFLVRIANHVLGLGCTILELDCACRFRKGVQLNEAKYIRHFLDACRNRGKQTEVEACMNTYRARLQPDPRLSISGHDFVSLLVKYLRSHPGFRGLNPATLGRSVLGCVELFDLQQEPVLRGLLGRLRS